VKPDNNSIEVYPPLRYMGHPVDGAMVGAGALWPVPDRQAAVSIVEWWGWHVPRPTEQEWTKIMRHCWLGCFPACSIFRQY